MTTSNSLTRKRPFLMLGHDPEHVRRKLYLNLRHLSTHVQIAGSSGCGKSRIMASLAVKLARAGAAVAVIDPKDDLAMLVTDTAIEQGMGERLVVFDPNQWGNCGATDVVAGFNPLRASVLRPIVAAKQCKEAVLAAYGISYEDEPSFPRLARVLFMAFYAIRLAGMSLVEAVELLRPDSRVRAKVLAMLAAQRAEQLRRSLECFDAMTANRQEELAASTLTRLESFVADDVIRHSLTQQRSLDMGRIIAERKIFVANLAQYSTLRPSESGLLARMLLHDLVGHCFARRSGPPVYVLVDEASTVCAPDFGEVLERGRSKRLVAILGHQYAAQFQQEKHGTLFKAIMNCCRTKIIGTTADADDAEYFAKNLFQYDPRRVTDPEMARISHRADVTRARGVSESVQLAVTAGTSEGTAVAMGASSATSVGATQGVSKSRGRGIARGTSDAVGKTITHSRSIADMRGGSRGRSVTLGRAETEGVTDTEGSGTSGSETIVDGEVVATGTGASGSSSRSHSRSTTRSSSQTDSETTSWARTRTRGRAESDSRQRTKSVTRSTHEEEGESASKSATQTVGASHTMTRSSSTNRSATLGGSVGTNRQVSIGEGVSIEPLSKEQFLTVMSNRLRALPTGVFAVQLPTGRTFFIRAPFLADPQVTPEKRQEVFARMYAREADYYATVATIVREEEERQRRLSAPSPAKPFTVPEARPSELGKGSLLR